MPGGYIFSKQLEDVEGVATFEKSLIIDPNYAYQVPFNFGSTWNDIKIGMFVSYVQTGVGVDSNDNAINGNSGVPTASIIQAGGVSNDGFNYVGIMKTSSSNSLPLASDNAGYLGLQADSVRIEDNNTTAYNKLYHSDETSSSSTAGDARFIATNGSTTLESKRFKDGQGNFNVIGLQAADAEAGDGSCENTTLFCDYWGMRFTVIDPGNTSTQRIRFTASINGTSSTQNTFGSSRAISDTSIQALKLLMNGVGEFQYKASSANMHNSTTLSDGFDWNNGLTAYTLPDSLFFYNAFTDIRPRIHAWAVKKIS
tara:strand:+ start:2125 stop:3060 length:936 start_codon:yes stop_codon:yes gene_type:complete